MKDQVAGLSRRFFRTAVTTSVFVVCISIALMHAGQGEAVTSHHQHQRHQRQTPFAEAPAEARARPNPFAGNRDSLLAGRKLFQRHCAECHGSSAEGGRRAPSLRAAMVQQATAGTLFWILTNGVVRRGMPVWSKLPEAQRWQIVTYLKALGPVQGPEGDEAHPSGRHVPAPPQARAGIQK